jgi:hypothetical protein
MPALPPPYRTIAATRQMPPSPDADLSPGLGLFGSLASDAPPPQRASASTRLPVASHGRPRRSFFSESGSPGRSLPVPFELPSHRPSRWSWSRKGGARPQAGHPPSKTWLAERDPGSERPARVLLRGVGHGAQQARRYPGATGALERGPCARRGRTRRHRRQAVGLTASGSRPPDAPSG